MATKHIIARGIGFSPASVKFIVTHGFAIGAPLAVPDTYDKEILSMQLCGDLSMTMGLRKAHSDMADDLESFAFFMGGG